MIAPAGLMNLVGFSTEEMWSLDQVLNRLRETDTDLYFRLVVYLLDGRGAHVLKELADIPNIAELMRVTFVTASQEPEPGRSWREFLQTLRTRDSKFFYRLGRALEAAITHLPPAVLFCQTELDQNRWLEMLLQEATQTIAVCPALRYPDTPLSALEVAGALAADGRAVSSLLTAAFRPDSQWNSAVVRGMVLSLRGMNRLFEAHPEVVGVFLVEGTVETRVLAIENLKRTDTELARFAAELVHCATDAHRTLREVGEALLREIPSAVRRPLEAMARSGETRQREQAVRLLQRLYADEARFLLTHLSEIESDPLVLEQLSASLRELTPDAGAAAWTANRLAPPPRKPVELHVPMTESLGDALSCFFQAYNRHVVKHNEKLAGIQPGEHIYPQHALSLSDEALVQRLAAALVDGNDVRELLVQALGDSLPWRHLLPALRPFVEHPDCRLPHVVRLMSAMGLVRRHFVRYVGGITNLAGEQIDIFRASHEPRATLSDVADVIRSLGLPEEMLIDSLFEEQQLLFDWEGEAVWPFLMRHLTRFEQVLAPIPAHVRHERSEKIRARERALKVLGRFPAVPPSLVGMLWEMAMGPSKAERKKARPICLKLPDLAERLKAALESNQRSLRSAANEWVGEIQHLLSQPAVPGKQGRVLDEDHASQLLTSLLRAGLEVDPPAATPLDRQQLLADARNNLKKGLPKSLESFPWNRLPIVHWSDNGQVVPAQVLQWLVVQAYKMKNPEPTEELSGYCALMNPGEREELGAFILKEWLSRDLEPRLSVAEARERARAKSQDRWEGYRTIERASREEPRYKPDFPQTLAEVEQEIFDELRSELGSAITEKGILAVAAATCGDAVVDDIEPYLAKWYQKRNPQCRALLVVLARIDSPRSISLLLDAPGRFRTPMMVKEAERLIGAVIASKGWTFAPGDERLLSAAEWKLLGADDPFARIFRRQLIWCAYEHEQLVAAFLPDIDDSLKDVNGERVELTEGMLVRVASRERMGADLSTRWQKRLTRLKRGLLHDQLASGK